MLNVSAAENTTWKEEPGKQGDRTWKRSDNKAIAIFPARQTFLYVQDPSYAQPEE
jgi:post-segregation antitoxin (ccd killing protein)